MKNNFSKVPSQNLVQFLLTSLWGQQLESPTRVAHWDLGVIQEGHVYDLQHITI